MIVRPQHRVQIDIAGRGLVTELIRILFELPADHYGTQPRHAIPVWVLEIETLVVVLHGASAKFERQRNVPARTVETLHGNPTQNSGHSRGSRRDRRQPQLFTLLTGEHPMPSVFKILQQSNSTGTAFAPLVKHFAVTANLTGCFPMANNSQGLPKHDLTSAIELLHQLIPKEELQAYSLRHSPATVYTTLTTLWMLTLQRLAGGKSLAANRWRQIAGSDRQRNAHPSPRDLSRQQAGSRRYAFGKLQRLQCSSRPIVARAHRAIS